MSQEVTSCFEWAKRIIESCMHPFHVDCARKVVEQFGIRYGTDSDLYYQLLEALVVKDSVLIV